MQTKNDVHAVIQDLKKKVPSFYSVPIESDDQEQELNEKKVIGAIVIQDGEFKDVLVVIRQIEVKGSALQIEYNASDKDKNDVESEKLNVVVGDLINYFLALETLEAFDKNKE